MQLRKIAGILICFIALILAFFILKGSQKKNEILKQPSSLSPSKDVSVISTSPANLDGATITPTQEVTITFSDPVLNKDELKTQIDPKIDYTATLSDDRKTVKITPSTPYGFNQQYTLHVSNETKFEGDKKMPGNKDFHFGTVGYSGV